MKVVNNAGVNKFSHAWFNKNLNLNGNHRKKGEAEDWQAKIYCFMAPSREMMCNLPWFG